MSEMDDSLFNDDQHDDSLFNDADLGPVRDEVVETSATVPAKHDVGSGTTRVLGEISMVPGAQGATAALKSIYDTATTKERKWGDILKLYEANRRNLSMADKQGQAQHPGAYLSGSMPISLLLGLANPGGIAAKTVATNPQMANLLGNAGNALALRASQEDLPKSGSVSDVGQSALNIASNTSKDILTGLGTQKAFEALANPRDTIKRIATAPRRAMEGIGDKLGGTSLGRFIGDEARPISPMRSSERVRELRGIVDAGEMGPSVASAVDDASRDLGGVAGKQLSALSPAEIGDVSKAIDRVVKVRGVAGTTPESHVSNWDNLLRSHGFDPAKGGTVTELVRAVGNGRDASYGASLLSGIAERNAGVGVGGQAQPVNNMFDAAKQARAEYLLGKINRAGQPKLEGDAGKYQFRVKELEDIASGIRSPRDAAALKLANAAQEGRANIGTEYQTVPAGLAGEIADAAAVAHGEAAITNRMPTWSSESPTSAAEAEMAALATPESKALIGALPDDVAAKIQSMTPEQRAAEAISLRQRLGGFNRDANAEREMSLDAIFARARELQKTLKDVSDAKFSAGQDASEQVRLDKAAQAASAELDRITTGRTALRRILGIGSGASAFASTGNPFSAVVAAGAGDRAIAGADALGSIGERIGKGAPPAVSASQMTDHAGGIEWVKKLASDGSGPLGAMARWVLSGDMANLPARLATMYRTLERDRAENQKSAPAD